VDVDQFNAALDDGVGSGVFGDDEDTRGIEISTARNWLFLLGYLRRDNEKKIIDEDLSEALMRFQADAGLELNGDSLDAESLAALVDLVSFDAGVAEAQRFDRVPLTSPSSLRAIALRLYALDLVERRPRRELEPEHLAEGLERLARVHRLLDLGALEGEPTPATVRALYSSEAVLARLRSEPNSLTIRHGEHDDTTQQRENRELVTRYINALARIELWLIGYLVRPRKHMWARDRSNASLPAALTAFWRSQPETERPPKSEWQHLTGAFFDRVQAVSEAAEDEEDRDEVIAERLLEDQDLARAVRDETRGLGARFLDGVRRVARFVLGWIRKRIGGLKALARNLARVLANRASSVFGPIKHIVLAVGDCWRFITGRPVAGSVAGVLVVLHDKDFDFTLVGGLDAPAAVLVEASRRLRESAGLLNATASFMQRLVGSFTIVVRRAGLGGWFGALLSILKLRERISEMREIAAQIVQHRERLATPI
jgi:hypothetical protein